MLLYGRELVLSDNSSNLIPHFSLCAGMGGEMLAWRAYTAAGQPQQRYFTHDEPLESQERTPIDAFLESLAPGFRALLTSR